VKTYLGKIAWVEVKGRRFENVAFSLIAPGAPTP
jgi:hypothetical protein